MGLVSPYFNSETDLYTLESWAVFGEIYWDFAEEWSLTLGARYTHDDKFVRDRQILYNTISAVGASDPIFPQPAYNED